MYMEIENNPQQVDTGTTLNQDSVSTNPISNQKGNFILIIGVVSLVLLIAVVAYYLLNSKQSQPLPSSIKQNVKNQNQVSNLKQNVVYISNKTLYLFDSSTNKSSQLISRGEETNDFWLDYQKCCIIYSTGKSKIEKVFRKNIPTNTVEDLTTSEMIGADGVSFSHNGNKIAIIKNNSIQIYDKTTKGIVTIAKGNTSQGLDGTYYRQRAKWSGNDEYLLARKNAYEGWIDEVISIQGESIKPKTNESFLGNALAFDTIVGWVGDKLYFVSLQTTDKPYTFKLNEFNPQTKDIKEIQLLKLPQNLNNFSHESINKSVTIYDAINKVYFGYSIYSDKEQNAYLYEIHTSTGEVKLLSESPNTIVHNLSPDSQWTINTELEYGGPENRSTGLVNLYIKSVKDMGKGTLFGKTPAGDTGIDNGFSFLPL